MRWSAERFRLERGDVEVDGRFFGTANDLLHAAFDAGASEAEALPACPEPGYATLRVSGLSLLARWRLARWLARHAPIGTEYIVEKIKGDET